MSTTIQPPIHLGYEGENVRNLQEVLLSFIKDGTLTLSDESGLIDFKNEMKDSFFGNHTAAVVRDFRTLKSISTPETTLVDETTADEINSTNQTNQDNLERTIIGRIINKNGKALTNLSVTIFDVDLRSRENLGTTNSDENGYFELSYDLADYNNIEKQRADIQLDVILSEGGAVTSDTYYNVGTDLIEFIIDADETAAYTSEYSDLATKTLPLLDAELTLEDLVQDDAEHLSSELNESIQIVQQFIYAQNHKVTTSVQADVFYGLFRKLLPTELEALLNQDAASLKSALQLSVATNIIDHYTEAEIDGFVSQLLGAYSGLVIDTKTMDVEDSRTYRILAISMTDAMIVDFINHYKEEHDEENFWDELQSNVSGMTSTIEEKLKHSLTLALLTGNNPALVKQLIEQTIEITTYTVTTTLYTTTDVNNRVYHSYNDVNYVKDADDSLHTRSGDTLIAVEGGAEVSIQSTETLNEDYTSTNNVNFVKVSDGSNYTRSGSNLESPSEELLPITDESSEISPTTITANPEIYVAQTIAEWETTINTAKTSFAEDFFYPEYIESETEPEKITEYAKIARILFNKSFPREFLTKSIENDESTPYPAFRDNIETFIGNNSGFDMKLTPAIHLKKEENEFDLSGIADVEEFVDELISIQRMGSLTNEYSVMKALRADGIDSASAVSAMSKEDFTDTYGSHYTVEGGADVTYDRANSTAALARLLAGNLVGILQDAPHAVIGLGNHNSIIEAIPELEAIFGNLDYCSCKHCRSVYSPSAYLVDSLELLRKYYNRAKVELLARREDINGVKLSCVNTNTPLPYIDIVNEILEDVIATSGATYTLTARDTTLNAKQLRAFPEYLNNGSTSADPYPTLRDAVYPWNLPYNYYQAQQGAYLDIVDIKPTKVAQVFSEFDKTDFLNDIDQACIYLGISPELKEILNNTATTLTDLKPKWGVFSSTANNNKIANPDKSSTTPFISTGTSIADFLDLFKQLHVFLQQSRLDFNEVLELLDCYFINPWSANFPSERELKILHKYHDPNVSITTCNPKELILAGPSEPGTAQLPPAQPDMLRLDHLSKFHRFVRLAKVLDWSYYDLDKVLMLYDIWLTPSTAHDIDIDNGAILFIAKIKEVMTRLNCKLEDVISLWDQTVQIRPYSQYGGDDPVRLTTQYEKLFRDKTVIDISVSGYPFPDDPTPLIGATAPFSTADIDAMVAGLAIDRKNLIYLVEEYANHSELDDFVSPGLTASDTITDVAFSLENVTSIYKEFTLAKLLKVDIKKWVEIRKWLESQSVDIDPFESPMKTLEFIDKFRTVKNAGFTIAGLRFLYDDVIEDSKERKNNEISLLQVLADIRAKWADVNDYFAENDTEGEILRKRLEFVLPEEQVDHVIEVLKFLPVNGDLEFGVPGKPSETSLEVFGKTIGEIPIPPSPPGNDPNVLLDLVVTSTEVKNEILGDTPATIPTTSPYILSNAGKQTLKERFEYFYKIASHAIMKEQLRQYLSETFEIESSSVDSLMTGLIEVGNKNGYENLLSSNFLEGAKLEIEVHTDLPTTIDSDSESAYIVVARLQKAAQIANVYNLNAEDLEFLSGDMKTLLGVVDLHNLPVNPLSSAASVAPNEWIRFTNWMHVRSAFDKAELDLFVVLEEEGTLTDSKEKWVDNMLTAFPNLTAADMAVLVGDKMTLPPAQSYATPEFILGLSFEITPTNKLDTSKYNPTTYWRIFDALDVRAALETTMESCAFIAGDILTYTVNTMDQTNVDFIIQLMKSRYDDEAWLDVVKPISDNLRIERRDAMVDFILGSPPDNFEGVWRTDLDLFEHLLIDVEMQPCMLTSRIKQAISSTQLFIDRCALKLEKDATGVLTLTPEIVRQWNLWRKFYRVWEANRKVFLYPENWIEPELRDNKSPFFVELEKFLKQNEVTQENVEKAYKTYLERLDEVAHMDPVGIHTDNKTGVTHAFARTKSHPHIYYYRKRAEKEWTAWEKMEVQIDGSHFIPVVFRGRIRLYWLVFTPDTLQNSPVTEFVGGPSTRWKLELAWTELRDGLWQAKQIGKEALYTSYITEINHTVESFRNRVNSGEQVIIDVDVSFIGDLDRMKNEGIIFYCSHDNSGNLKFVIGEEYFGQHIYPTNGWLYNNGVSVNVASSGLFKTWIDKYKNEERLKLKKIWSVGVFHEKYNGIVAEKHGAWHGLDNSFYKYLNAIEYKEWNTSYIYDKPESLGYTHEPDLNFRKLLDRAPNYELTSPSEPKFVVLDKQVPLSQNPADKVYIHKFFYHDYRNCFFVERTTDPVSYSSASLSKPYAGLNTTLLIQSGLGSSSMFHLLGGPGATALASGDNGAVVAVGSGDLLQDVTFEPVWHTPTGIYKFYPFYHYNVDSLADMLSKEGLDGLFDFAFTNGLYNVDSIQFQTEYKPVRANVKSLPHDPKSTLDFSYEGAYSIYNWELFFHIPLLIANKLMQDQKFLESRQWFHYIFDPTSGRTGGPERFWNFIPFEDEATVLNNSNAITIIQNATANTAAVDKWAANPFNPHLIARMRISAYMKNVVMKYLDNLIAWGDQLFRRDTMESINEATLMYILAAQILGRKPYKLPARASVPPKSYNDFVTSGGTNAFSNAAFAIETLLLPTGVDSQAIISSLGGSTVKMDYFCIPPNEKLLSYWDVVADRLFKIRHCQNIEGVERQLALFAPPIDPALLVKAAANGVSISAALDSLMAPLPQYRFHYIVNKASELAQEVKSLGGSLLSALEKRDAEKIALLRSTHEISVLEANRELRNLQLKEAEEQIKVLDEQKKMITFRREYYNTLVEEGLNAYESLQLESLQKSIPLKIVQGVLQTLGGTLSGLPDFKLGSPMTIGATFGGNHLGNMIQSGATAVGIAATVNDIKGSMAGTKGSFKRREEEWKLQSKLAQRELNQVEKQLIAAQIRQSISQTELQNHELQMRNTREMDELMHSKYTNEELYNWMIGEIALTYFQTYNLAIDVAKQAERCYGYELGINTSNFIGFGYWNSLKKGLQAGEQLMYDIKRMDISFMEQHKRQHEMTKHISLATWLPEAVMELKNGGSTMIEIPEWLFDMDYPGHYFRRIKSVSISIPCVAGPHTTISCKLTQTSSKYRKQAIVSPNGYNDEANYNVIYGGGQSIATSHAQNDSGMFDFNFKDERYLPFEGSGAISNWTIELPSKYAQFDYDTITDVILHINYTARFDGGLATHADGNLTDELTDDASDGGVLSRIFSLKHEFSNEWNKFINDVQSDSEATLDIDIVKGMFPYFCNELNNATPAVPFTINFEKLVVELTMKEGKTISNFYIKDSAVGLEILDLSSASGSEIKTDPSVTGAVDGNPQSLSLQIGRGAPYVALSELELENIRDIHFAVIYTLS